jgi:putative transposase
MTTTQKVALVADVWEEQGLRPALAAMDLPKSTWYYHQQHQVPYAEKYAHLKPILEEIIRAHPEYGVPRIMPELRETHDVHVNHKVIERLLRQWDLSLLRSIQRPQPSAVRQAITAAEEQANLVAQLTDIGLFQVLYTDFTELRYANGQDKAWLMPLQGHAGKLVYGWAVGRRANTTLALRAWKRAKTTLQQLGRSWTGMIVHHDRDTVYTGYGWTAQLLLEDRVRLSYALRGGKDNPQIESFNGHFKGENHSLLLEAQTLSELQTLVAQRMQYYNQERRHSSIGYVSPLTYIKQHRLGGRGTT